MSNFTIMRNGLNTEIAGDPHIGQSSEDVTVTVTDDGTYSGYTKKLYYSYCYHNEVHRALSDVNSNDEFIIPVQAFFEPGMVKLTVELSNGTNCPACNACFLVVTDGAKDVDASVLPSEKTWQSYIQSYLKSDIVHKPTVDALEKRIDNLILSSGTESSAEIIDARTGYDGTAYDTLGTAIRGQVQQLNDSLDNRVQLIAPINLFDKSKVVYGKFMAGQTGEAIQEKDNNEFAYVILPIITPSNYKMTGTSFYCYTIDADRKIIHLHGNPNGTAGLVIWEDTPSAKYIVINYRPAIYPTDSFMFVKGKELPSNYTPYFDEYCELSKSQYYATLNDLSKVETGEKYFVGANRQYKSFIKCIKELANNNNKKTIYVDGGEYDIFNEIGGKAFCDTIANDETDWKKYSVIIPPNTTIIGLGNVVFNFTPTIEEIGNGLKLLSPINIQGTCHLENITINASNCRYCIHDETSGDTKFTGAKKTYKNIHCIKSGSGQPQAYACGFDDLMEFEFDNCIFESTLDAFSMHNRNTENADKSSRININECVFIAKENDNSRFSVRFGNVNWREEQIKVFISNSYMSHKVLINHETNYGIQNYDVTMIGCNRDNIDIILNEGDTNRLVPTIYKW